MLESLPAVGGTLDRVARIFEYARQERKYRMKKRPQLVKTRRLNELFSFSSPPAKRAPTLSALALGPRPTLSALGRVWCGRPLATAPGGLGGSGTGARDTATRGHAQRSGSARGQGGALGTCRDSYGIPACPRWPLPPMAVAS